MNQSQPGFEFDDPESRTRSNTLEVVYARAESVGRFDPNLFHNFASMRALTYTASIPMILGLLRDCDFQEFECVFGHGGILPRDVDAILSFQSVVDERLNKGFVGIKGMSDERRRLIYDRAAAGTARFYVVKDAIAHAKIYLLERPDLRRVIVGSANLSETAFSGRQAETLIVFDNDEEAWRHYCAQYEAVREIATSSLPLRERPVSVESLPLEETPVLRDAESHADGVTIYVPAEPDGAAEFSIPQVLQTVERIRPVRRQALADIRPDRSGNVKILPRVVREIVRTAIARKDDEAPKTFLTRNGDHFNLSGTDVSLDASPEDVRNDVAAFLEFFGNYENGFVGDVPRLQRDYFTFMCWFYFAPLMCDLRNAALRQGNFSFDQPIFAVLYGQSNCGKSRLIETLMVSMFGHPKIVDTQAFTRSNLRGLQQNFLRFPIVFDDVTRDRFNRHAPEIIKDETVHDAEYPCFAISMNAEARNFPAEIIKRCLMIYTRTSLPGDDPSSRRRLLRSVSAICDRLTTGLYREYLAQVLEELDTIAGYKQEGLDVLELSSTVLCRIIERNLPENSRVPDWCSPMTLDEYQNRAFDRPRMVLENLLHRDKYSKERRPAVGSWAISGDLVLVGVEPITARQTRADIPDWILDDTASVSDQIAMKRDLLQDFLGQKVAPPRRFFGLVP